MPRGTRQKCLCLSRGAGNSEKTRLLPPPIITNISGVEIRCNNVSVPRLQSVERLFITVSAGPLSVCRMFVVAESSLLTLSVFWPSHIGQFVGSRESVLTRCIIRSPLINNRFRLGRQL